MSLTENKKEVPVDQTARQRQPESGEKAAQISPDADLSHSRSYPASEEFTGIVVNHTHWDREWYMPFQRYRVLLVDAVDRLLQILAERPDYATFTLDGQTVVLEDYLEVRPEMRPQLAAFIGSGRIALGPWYVLPDEFIPSGESLIRNLLLGRKQMQAIQVPPAKVGYLPDTFGHPAQLPQVLAGFDLNSAIIFRGVQSDTSEFIWDAPDGTGLLTIYLPGGYYNAMELARAPEYWLKEKLQTSLDFLTRFATTKAVLVMNGCDHFEPQPATQEFLDRANQVQDRVFLRQGTLDDYVELVRREIANLAHKKGEWRYNRPARITPGILSARMYLKQADFRSSITLERGAEPLQGLAWVLGYRHDSGLLGTAWRYLLQNHPHDSICGCSVDEVHKDGETRYRWTQQIGNDLVERAANFLTRFPKAVHLSPLAGVQPARTPGFRVFNTLAAPRTEIVRQTLHFLQPGVCFQLLDPAGQKVPFQELGREKVKIEWDPQRQHYFCEGRSRPALVVSAPAHDTQYGRERWQRWVGEEVELLFKAELPAGGFTTLQVVPVSPSQNSSDLLPSSTLPLSSLASPLNQPAQEVGVGTVAQEKPVREGEPVKDGNLPAQSGVQYDEQTGTLENELVRLKVASNGTFSLLDKTSGRLYGPLNQFRSEADRGDEYSFCPAPADAIITSHEAQAKVKLVEQGPLRATLEIKFVMTLPACLADDRTRRVSDMVEVPICTRISLSFGRRRIEIVTEIENRACDHRLRAYFASGVFTDTAHAQGQFMVMPRAVDLPVEERTRFPEFDEEQEVNYHPQRNFVDVSDRAEQTDKSGGLAVLNRGLPEYEAESSPEGVWLGLTLLRCVGWLSRDDLSTRYKHAGPALETPEAQCPGKHRFEYAVLPHRDGWLKGGVAQEAEAYVTPVYSASFAPGGLTRQEQGPDPQQGQHSFYRLEPSELLFSGCKRSEDGSRLLLRAYNTADYPLQGGLHLGLEGPVVRQANLAEREISPELAPGQDGAYHFAVRPHEIVTFSIEAANPGFQAIPGNA